MSTKLTVLIAVTIAFAILTAVALADVGYFGIFAPHLQSWGGAQVLADLVILGVLACVWMAGDARSSALPAWPFIVLTFLIGSFGVLFYLIAREATGRAAPAKI